MPWQDSWRNHNPNFTYIFWTDDDNRKLIQDFYPWFLSTYDALPKTIQRVDASRIFYLHRYGGVYSDLDVQCLKPIDPLLRGHELVLGRMGPDYHYEHSIPNAWMASKPGHVFWMWCARWIMENKHLWHKSVEGTAGPIMIFSVLNAYGRHVFEEEKNGKKMDTICVADKGKEKASGRMGCEKGGGSLQQK